MQELADRAVVPIGQMEAFSKRFSEACIAGNGYQLADTLLPFSSPEEPDRLRNFYRSTNAASVRSDIQYSILYDRATSLRLSTEEGKAWVDVYAAYWAALNEILQAEEAQETNKPVRILPCLSF